MNRKIASALVLVLFVPLAAMAQSIVPLPDCCPRIYDTGRWLGWAAAMLEYARDIGGPTPAEGDIIRCLFSAGQSAQAAYQACSSGVPAWPDWKQRQLWINGWSAELRHPGNSSKPRWMRWELVASAVDTAYGQWADALSWEKIDGQMLKRKTCAAGFFQLGFDLALATQAYRLALAANADRSLSTTQRLQVTLRELNRTRLRLKKALAVLDAYQAVKGRNADAPGCPDFGEAELERGIRDIALTAPSMTRAAQEFRYVSNRSDDVGILLAQNCVAAGQRPAPANTEPAPPPTRISHSGQTFIGTYVRLNSLRRSQGYRLNEPILVCERTGPRTYRVVRYFELDHQTGRFGWKEPIDGNEFEVFGEWLCQHYKTPFQNRILSGSKWLPKIPDEWLPRLREVRIGVGDHLFPPNLPDTFSSFNTPAHCAGNDPRCNGDISGNWVDEQGWCIRIEPEKK